MNIEKVFSKILKAKSNDKNISVVSDYDNIKMLLKYILALPDTYIVSIRISNPDFKGYLDPYTIEFTKDGEVYCFETMTKTGGILRTDGLCLIDIDAIGEHKPEDFVIADESTIKLIKE